MKDKKNEKFDLSSLRWLIYTIGLVITLGVVVITFESFGYYEEEDRTELAPQDIPTEETLDIPLTEVIPPPPPPVPQQPEIIEVPDDEEIEELEDVIDAELNENTIPPPPAPPAPPKNTGIAPPPPKKKEKVQDVFLMAEEQPAFEGGNKKFAKYLRKNLKYPPQARRQGIEGKVFVEFIVNKDGSLVDIKVIKGIGAGCDEEAVRVLKKSPKWKPGKQRGKSVRVKMSVPIVFKLN